MKYTTIFFDLDDTLIDTEQNSRDSLKDIYTDYQFSNYFPSLDDFTKKYMQINLHLWDLYEHGHITKDTLQTERFKQTLEGFISLSPEQSLDINHDFLARTTIKKNVIGGVKEVLEYLYPKYPLYILSNGFEEIQERKMQTAELKPYFKKVILSDHIGKNKPHPDIFLHALKEANSTHTNSIMIGDNIRTDITGAKNSEIDQVWYNPQNLSDEYNVSPTYTIQNLEELKNIL